MKKFYFLMFALVAALTIVSCGGDDSEPTDPNPTPTPEEQDVAIFKLHFQKNRNPELDRTFTYAPDEKNVIKGRVFTYAFNEKVNASCIQPVNIRSLIPYFETNADKFAEEFTFNLFCANS